MTAFLRLSKRVPILVLFLEQADSLHAYEAAVQAASVAAAGSPTPRQAQSAGRAGVVQALQIVAAQSHSAIAPLLKQLRAAGHCSGVHRFFVINAMALEATREGVDALAAHPAIARILPDRWVTLDPILEGEPVPEQRVGWNLTKIGAPAVWALGIDGSGVTVGSIDTGVEYGHPALERKFRGYNAADPSHPSLEGNWYDAVHGRQGLPYDDHRHGTHVTGTMVGDDPGGASPIGVAPGARWIAAKGFNERGQGSSSWLLAAGEWMLAPRDAAGTPHPEWAPDVINNSWGGGPGVDEWYRPLITNWRNAGIIPLVAAGNGGPDPGSLSSPGNYPEAIAVGAMDSLGRLASFSGRGPSPYGEIKPEITAPGSSIRSAVPGGGYSSLSGTSMATPHISGVAALLLSAAPGMTPDQVESVLTATAVPQTNRDYPESPNNGFGYGLVSALAALSAIRGTGTIAGRVLGPERDDQPPEIAHQPVSSAYALVSLALEAAVSDSVGVARVEIRLRRPGESTERIFPMRLLSGEPSAGRYAGEIPPAMILPPSVEYRLCAVDEGGLEAFAGPFALTVRPGLAPGYRQDFEQPPEGYLTGGTHPLWSWGEPLFPQPRSGRRLFGTALDGGSYPALTQSYLQLPPIDLRGHAQARLHLWQWYETGDPLDYTEVLLSTDGGEHWSTLHRQSGSSGDWEQLRIDLTPHAGRLLLVRLCLRSGQAVNGRGWFIDDLAILGPDGRAPGAPGSITAEPTALGSIRLAWSAPPDEGIARYRVQRASAPLGPFETVGETAALAFFDNGAPQGRPSIYRVLAVDYWGGVSEPSITVSAAPLRVQQLFADDFEAESTAWSTQGSLWEHGIPSSGPGSAFSGQRVWATRLDGNYTGSQIAWVTSPEISLEGFATAALQFAHWYHTEINHAFADVEVSVDGGLHWSGLARYSGLGRSWRQPILDLTPYVGQRLRLRFRFTSDPSTQYAGWYLDDVRVAGQPAAISQGQTAEEAQAALPLRATVTVTETGRSVQTDPVTGGYSMTHRQGDWTVRAEASGLPPAEQRITLPPDTTVLVDFTLGTAPGPGGVEGIVRNGASGTPLAGVLVGVAEAPALPPVQTGAGGLFRIDLEPGSYTLRLELPFFYPLERPVRITAPGETLSVELSLRPFIAGEEALLAYDDGSFENSDAWTGDGSGWAVRMTPPAEGGMLVRASFLLMDSRWPVPGGDRFRMAIYDSDGAAGGPGRLLAEERPVAGLRSGEWTEVDLSALGLVLQREFYVAYLQEGTFPAVPGLTTDTTEPFRERSWERDGGDWYPSAAAGGNRMIRAVLRRPISPTLELLVTEPADGRRSTRETVTVTGQVLGSTQPVAVTAGGQRVTLAEDGSFSHLLPLRPGANLVAVVARDGGGEERRITRTVIADWPPLRLLNLAPCGDRLLTPGQPFPIRFDGEPGGSAGWVLLLFGDGDARAVTGPMTEASPGHYEGSYTLPLGASIASAMLVLHLVDGRGNSGSAVLPARLLPA